MAEIRGVNLGGWFVLEKWMKPELFKGVSGPDETVFCKEKENAEEELLNHWNTFITEEDFKYLKEIGINSVRIPIPWWGFKEHSLYYSCLKYLDQAMDWAHKYQLKVLLDLHTAPGCQNGFDNGGITGVIDWPKDQNNIDTTVEVLELIAIRYKNHKALWGIEVLNEPHKEISLSLIQNFYLEAYKVLRKHLKKQVIVFHDAFRPKDPSWKVFFKDNQFDNVVFDLHLYQCFNPKFEEMKIEQHINEAMIVRKKLVEEVSSFVRVIVGEWSLGLHEHVLSDMDDFSRKLALTLYSNSQLYTFEHGYGWYFWNYKIDSQTHKGWNFKHLVNHGIMPNKY